MGLWVGLFSFGGECRKVARIRPQTGILVLAGFLPRRLSLDGVLQRRAKGDFAPRRASGMNVPKPGIPGLESKFEHRFSWRRFGIGMGGSLPVVFGGLRLGFDDQMRMHEMSP
jgi:hypothetical protein